MFPWIDEPERDVESWSLINAISPVGAESPESKRISSNANSLRDIAWSWYWVKFLEVCPVNSGSSTNTVIPSSVKAKVGFEFSLLLDEDVDK